MILAVVGLTREARIVAGEGVRTVIGGADAEGLARQLERIHVLPEDELATCPQCDRILVR